MATENYLLCVLSHGGGARAFPLHLSVEGTVLCCVLVAGTLILLVAAVRMPARCLADLTATERDVEVKRVESKERASSRVLSDLLAQAERKGALGNDSGKPADGAGGREKNKAQPLVAVAPRETRRFSTAQNYSNSNARVNIFTKSSDWKILLFSGSRDKAASIAARSSDMSIAGLCATRAERTKSADATWRILQFASCEVLAL